MPSSKDLKATKTPSILLVGDGGTRKTRLLASMPKAFIYDFDAGLRSAREFEFEYETFKDAPYGSKAFNKDQGSYEWGTAWPAWIKHLNEVMWPRIKSGESQITLGVDSITTLSMQCMNYVLKASGKTGKDNPEIQHWGSQLRLLESVMDQLAAWPVRFVATAHIKRDENLVTSGKEYLPLVNGQLSAKIGIYFDEVYYTETKGSGDKQTVHLVTQTNSLYRMAKSRHNVPTGTEASWSKLEKYI